MCENRKYMERLFWPVLVMVFLVTSCKKPFDLPAGDIDNSILIVEGTIAVGDNAENIFKLSRLSPLESGSAGIPEYSATVHIVSSNGTIYPLNENLAGSYTAVLSLPETDSYKLQVQTSGGDQYESKLEAPVLTPEIDSVTWKQPEEVNFYVHTHDDTKKTRNYRWEYSETWEYNAWFEATLDFKNGTIVSRPAEEQVYTCWKSDSSKSILIGTSSALSDDVISYQPLNTVTKLTPLDRNKFSVRYSILVKQLGLTKEAYNFWDILKKNTELSGTLFDPQPSRLASNIQCINDPSKEVIGFVSVGKITTKRIFVRHSELRTWPVLDESETCQKTTMAVAEAEAYLANDNFYRPVTYVERTNNSMVYISSRSCMDCTLRDGQNKRPDYW